MNNTQSLPIIDSHNPRSESIPTARVIDEAEKRDDWIEHREIVVPELCPVGALETLYALRAAGYLWRLDRVIGFENAATIGEIVARSEKSLEDSQESRVYRDSPDQPTLQSIIKYEAHLVRCLAGTMAELRRLQKERRQRLRHANPLGRGADRAGNCEHQQIKDGSPGGSPSQKSSSSCKITCAEMLVPGGRGADRAGDCQKEFDTKGSHGGSPSHKILDPGKLVLGGRGVDRAGDCQKEFDTKGSPGGSPSQTSAPSQKRSPMQASLKIQADSPANNQNVREDGSPGGSPFQRGSRSRIKHAGSPGGSPSR